MKILIWMLLALSHSVYASKADPRISERNLYTTVCVPGYTAGVRPDVDYTNDIKRALLPAKGKMRDYQLDHAMPLGVGGHPSDPDNLQLQPLAGKCGAKVKDVDEARWHRKLCKARSVTLKDAQAHFNPWVCKK